MAGAGAVIMMVVGGLIMLYGSFVHPSTFSGYNPSAVQLTQIYTDSLRWSMGGMSLLLLGWVGIMSAQLKRIEDAIKGEEEEPEE